MAYSTTILAHCDAVWGGRQPSHLWQSGLNYQTRLIEALRDGDADRARAVMEAHMATAHGLMRTREAAVTRRFLSDRTRK